MNPLERIKSAIRPARPAVEYFGADGSRRDATEELRRCFEGPVEIDPSRLPVEFAGRAQMAFGDAPQRGTDEGLLVFAKTVEMAFGATATQETDEPQPDTYASLDSSLQEPLVTHHPARTNT